MPHVHHECRPPGGSASPAIAAIQQPLHRSPAPGKPGPAPSEPYTTAARLTDRKAETQGLVRSVLNCTASLVAHKIGHCAPESAGGFRLASPQPSVVSLEPLGPELLSLLRSCQLRNYQRSTRSSAISCDWLAMPVVAPSCNTEDSLSAPRRHARYAMCATALSSSTTRPSWCRS